VIGTLRSAAHPLARTVDVVVVGAGHAGLAISHCLTERGIDHVVLERGEVANSWRRERWDSLRLLTPNWQSRLPGHRYDGADPDGFMTMPEVVDFIRTYVRRIDAPVCSGTTVTSIRPTASGYHVVTDRGEWWCAAVVLASGACNLPAIPAVQAALPASIASVTPLDYRNPNQLDAGGVLVVGASATGLQLADEIHRSGRPVTVAVGEHIRLPRTYRGRDIQHWMDLIGVLDERYDTVDDIVRARRVPSPQLVGTTARSNLDLNVLRKNGVRLVGRLVGVARGKAQFSGGLRNHCAMADLKMARLLDRIDAWIERSASVDAAEPAERPAPTRVDDAPRLDLGLDEIRTVVWATGYRPDYRWLHVPVLDAKGRVRHDGGVVDAPGMYLMGLPFMRRRKSSFIHGAEDDARDLTAHLSGFLNEACGRGVLVNGCVKGRRGAP
jgi:putative flavoprotein involved in K+ transport